mmetsp:Transcript_7593/g.12029  ORF Transcript_7593/g.12029 Transcript_7593/m.12029 type:complete len:131 (+) Transcript_7593:251-643(+)|eukprot:CAMPEP_0178733354 /NCGR_PEP_ID=MMETSP0744-20121128/748_1 /TAXON_ID=913974 /ORGANISM="Nitzschia punctata, Strain CCMP561" /LENGTH=130 /DNA_ID=CAMNT_0020385527 /DNA_START=346 /DNA_END=738 /DNA_ORIENTATION=+
MTYKSRGRSLTEILVAVTFVCFLLGFVAVLCIGNFYRAKRAMERQRQRRLARLSGHKNNGVLGDQESSSSPRSTISGASSAHSEEQRNLLLGGIAPFGGGGGGILPGGSRRRNVDEAPPDLLNRPNIQAI